MEYDENTSYTAPRYMTGRRAKQKPTTYLSIVIYTGPRSMTSGKPNSSPWITPNH
jgi:hypothetical protein